MAEGRRIRVPEEDYDFVVAFVSFLSNWRLSHSGTQEEREKEKEPKRNKEKEEKNSLSTREALLNSILENNQKENLSEMPTQEEVQDYLDQVGEKRFTAARFIGYYKGFKHTGISDWRSVVDIWRERERKSVNSETIEGNERQKTKTNKSESYKGLRGTERTTIYPSSPLERGQEARSGTSEGSTGAEVSIASLPRREQVEKILQEKYPVDDGQAERLAAVVARAIEPTDNAATADGTVDEESDRIDLFARDFGNNVVVHWLGKAILARAEALDPDGKYTAADVLKDAESTLVCAKTAYKELLTATVFQEILDSLPFMTRGVFGMAMRERMKI